MVLESNAYSQGFIAGRQWIGPEGDGGLGSASLAFIEEQAERFACGREFSNLRDGPTAGEQWVYREWMRGHADGRDWAYERKLSAA